MLVEGSLPTKAILLQGQSVRKCQFASDIATYDFNQICDYMIILLKIRLNLIWCYLIPDQIIKLG